MYLLLAGPSGPAPERVLKVDSPPARDGAAGEGIDREVDSFLKRLKPPDFLEEGAFLLDYLQNKPLESILGFAPISWHFPSGHDSFPEA